MNTPKHENRHRTIGRKDRANSENDRTSVFAISGYDLNVVVGVGFNDRNGEKRH